MFHNGHVPSGNSEIRPSHPQLPSNNLANSLTRFTAFCQD